jgi:Flp pilus assembly protein TadG
MTCSGLINRTRRFARSESGAALVEFGIVTPFLLLALAVVIDGARVAWSYQTVSNGVRDAARMVARVGTPQPCVAGIMTAFDGMVTQIVTEAANDAAGSVVPHRTTVIDVTPTLRCEAGIYRGGTAAIVEVRAQIQIEYLLGGVFGLFGTALDTLNTEVADQSRIYET